MADSALSLAGGHRITVRWRIPDGVVPASLCVADLNPRARSSAAGTGCAGDRMVRVEDGEQQVCLICVGHR
ncbi:hypothetical protein Aca07nite_38010 [Actinoplanes capillaceus]|uniref:Uncharacterized protein n=1 Tax=Actinoplanes campanulatus TaxID=113559 RepID=A0ABQ3WJW5_9ACTN|nr:hypothetical protein Aca07nite_38010 [Actinoplanes capillaceus]